MKFLVDNQLPKALARWLEARGCDCILVTDAGLETASDAAIWQFACEQGRILITKDQDFLFRTYKTLEKAGLIWVRLGNCRSKELVSAFEKLWPKVEASLIGGEKLVEVR